MVHLQLLGVVLEHLGQELQKPDSRFSRKFMLSFEQFCALLRIIRIATSPSVQTLYMYDLVHRWQKSDRTIQNWIDLGILPQGHKRQHDTRMFWYASELEEVEEKLISFGYVKHKRKNPVVRMIDRVRSFLVFKEC